MSGFSNALVGGSGGLVYPSIHSPNFVQGSTGWSIDKNGNASFSDVELTGGSLIVTQTGAGVFIYDGTPAAGNLIASAAESFGTDVSGNEYLPGFTSYEQSSPSLWLACQSFASGVVFYQAASYAGPWAQQSSIAGDTNSNIDMTALGSVLINVETMTGQPASYRIDSNGLHVVGTSWTPLVGATNWVAGGASYQFVPLVGGAVAFKGTITTPAAGSYNGVVATTALPAAYIPSTARRWPVVNSSAPLGASGYAILNTSGVLMFQGLPASYNNSNVEITGTVWL